MHTDSYILKKAGYIQDKEIAKKSTQAGQNGK